MIRIFSEQDDPQQGGAFRDLAVAERPCFDTGNQVTEITQPGCFEFPVTDNDFGAVPTVFAGDVDIDPFDYDNRFEFLSDLDLTTIDPDFVDLWSLLPSGLQDDVYELRCYCPGEGIDRAGLSIGAPRFPSINALPFFWVPPFIPAVGNQRLRIREINPDGPKTPANCCPGFGFGFDEEGNPVPFKDFIKAKIVDNEIQLTHIAQEEPERVYRGFFLGKDISPSYLLQAGFPRWCCMEDDCDAESSTSAAASTSSGITGSSSTSFLASTSLSPFQDKFNLHFLHFPRWLNDVRNPYASSSPEEPVGIIPIIVDIQCDPVSGKLFIYFARIKVHDGLIIGLDWNTLPPREPVGAPPITEAPTDPNPETSSSLPYNEDYEGLSIINIPPIGPGFPDLGDDECANQCDGLPESCDPMCPAGICETIGADKGLVNSGEVVGTGATELDAIQSAVDAAETLSLTIPSCENNSTVFICFLNQKKDNTWESLAALCCGASSSSSSTS